MTPVHLDLDTESRRVLEFAELLEWLAGFAVTDPGAARIRGLRPLADVNALREEIAAVGEARRFLAQEGRMIGGRLSDPRPATDTLGVEGARLEALTLRDLAATLVAGADLRSRLQRLPESGYLRLRETGRALPDLRREAQSILRGIEPDGRIADDASAELRALRGARGRVGQKLRRMLETLLHRPESGSVIQDDFITQRNERFVIPVRTDSPRGVRGIVHATSSSGATQFVEPIESVELNNELVRLAELEQAEQERLLLGWSDDLRGRLEEVRRIVDLLARVDSLQARALFAQDTGAVDAVVVAEGRLLVRAVRHPLLERRLREEGQHCVPLDLLLDPFDQVVVVSGPNTGGKTVALKTFGLTVVMAQCAIPVLAEEATLPAFRQLRADIGDHQSIEADLSTFSAHVRALAGFLDAAEPPALFLFDEIGTGTEPTEGAALAQAVLEGLRAPGMTALATTHHGALKAWAFTTAGVVSAAMEFDDASLRPTYRMLTGAAGTSAGLEIAARLGLERSVVERARELLGHDRETGERYMARLREMTARVERELEELSQRGAALEAERRRIEQSAAEREQRRAVVARQALDHALAGLRELGRRELASLRERHQRQRLERDLSRLHGRVGSEGARALQDLGLAGAQFADEGWREPTTLEAGQVVRVRSLGREGRVRGVRGRTVEVLLGSAVFKVDRSDLRVRPGADTPTPPSEQRRRTPPNAEAVTDLVSTGVESELKLLGMRVEEGLQELDGYLDRAAVAGLTEVRVVHGHGTGRLRRAVRDFLRRHAQVSAQRPGKPREGGDGATVVTLK